MLRRALSTLLLGTSLGLAALTGPAVAQSASVPPPDIAARSWFLFDVTTNTVLYSQTPDERVEPASLTKLMTAYVVFEALRDGTLKPDARPPVSNRAYKSAGSRMFVDPRSPATVDELLHGLIIQSGNDAAIILAEAVAGSEEQFAEQMNAEARRLGMKNSHFVNVPVAIFNEVSSNNLIASNIVAGAGIGIHVSGSNDTRVWNNTVSHALTSLWIQEDTRSDGCNARNDQGVCTQVQKWSAEHGLSWDTTNTTVMNKLRIFVN